MVAFSEWIVALLAASEALGAIADDTAQNAERTGTPCVVEDAVTEPIPADNPLVLVRRRPQRVRETRSPPRRGQVLGTCGTMGDEAHQLTCSEVKSLQELSGRIVAELERHAVG